MGHAPQHQKRSPKRVSCSGLYFAINLIIGNVFLIYMSYNPNKFTKATSSGILNYGIWIQTEVSLILALWFMLREFSKTSNKWTMGENFVAIDKIFKNEFSMNLCYKDFKLLAILSSCAGGFGAIILLGLTIYYLIDLPFEPFHKACVCYSIYVSNISIFAVIAQFTFYIGFVFMRFHAINNILRQLLFDDSYLLYTVIDESTSKELIYTNYRKNELQKNCLNKNSNVSSIHMSDWIERRKKDYGNHQKPPIKLRFFSPWKLAVKSFISKPTFYESSKPSLVIEKITTLISLHEKLTETVALLNDLYSKEFFFILMLIFTYLLFGLFSRYVVLFDYQVEAFKISSLNLAWMQAYTASVASVISLSSILTKRAKQTAVIVHRVIRKTKNIEIQDKLFRFSKILYTRHVTLNFGLINFDWPLLFQLVGAVASYLIILVQFQLSSKRI